MKDGIISMIMPELNYATSVNVFCIDDDGNMIVDVDGKGRCFINHSKRITALLYKEDILRNGLPINKYCLPGQLKTDKNGKLYFSEGMWIRKFFKEEFPYFDVKNSTKIFDQNSKGMVIGSIYTYYAAKAHAFLAIPEQLIDEENE
jgi:hypothetical protein